MLFKKQLRTVALACSLMVIGSLSPAWGVVPNASYEEQGVTTGRMVAMSIGAIGGILIYSAITGDWSLGIWGVEAASTSVAAAPATGVAASTAATGIGTAAVTAATPAAATTVAAAPAATVAQVVAAAPNAAAEFVAAWGGRQVFVPASALVGALIGDWMYSIQ
ncbi:hypothetical protein TI03_06965 [Achromatium sp. WMS1]|nr:hypothetical protein TI03_06965 [Achromatium sp. WMS1]